MVMEYKRLIDGAKRYKLEDYIYDLASMMISRHGILSKEALAGVFVLIFSWNRDYYSPPSPSPRKPIGLLDQHVKQLETSPATTSTGQGPSEA
jgi:hypothetical protein